MDDATREQMLSHLGAIVDAVERSNDEILGVYVEIADVLFSWNGERFMKAGRAEDLIAGRRDDLPETATDTGIPRENNEETENPLTVVVEALDAALRRNNTLARWQIMIPVTPSPIRCVMVVSDHNMYLDDYDVRVAESLTRLSANAINRQVKIDACPGHKWEFEFKASYLDGATDALCMCGARRSDVEAQPPPPPPPDIREKPQPTR